MKQSTLPTVYAVQNPEGTFWGENGTPVTELKHARIFPTTGSADRSVNAANKKVAQLGGLKVKVVPVTPVIDYVLQVAEVPAEVPPTTDAAAQQ